ncbi:MAG: hypothetical protein NVS3B14_19330 [Ktedonobacteraceae bacterium]
MDVYRALNADVPQLLFTVLHQAGPTVSEEDFTRTVTALHQDIRRQTQEVGAELQRWLQQQSLQQAEETARKLQRLGLLAEKTTVEAAQQALERDFRRFAGRIGSESALGMQGSGEMVFAESTPGDLDLAKRVADGREYLMSLGFKPGQGPLHEAWLLFRGSVHYDVMERVVRDRMGIYTGSHGDHIEYVGRTSFGTYNMIYQLGEELTADLTGDVLSQEVTFAFSKGPVHYSPFRQEVSALLEHVGEQMNLIHASFWQRKLGLGTGKEFVLRLRVPVGEEALRQVIETIANGGRVGKETIVKRGKMLLGRRVL